MVKVSNKGLLIIAVILSLLITALVYSYLKKTSNSQPKDTVSVVVAKVDIGPKTKITPEMLQTISIPAPYLQPGIVTDNNEVVGTLAREQILTGEQITARRLIVEGKSAGFTGLIPADKRAVAVGVTEVTGVAGFVKAGDYVDVVVIFDQNTVGDNVGHLVLQNVLVLAANRETEAGGVDSVNAAKDKASKEVTKTATVTLAVNPDEASKLALSEEKGKIRLALRPFLQNAGTSLAGPVTPKDIVGIHTSPAPNEGPKDPAPVPSPSPSKSPVSGIQMIRGTKTEIVPVN